MAGSLNPGPEAKPAGFIAKRFSADGSHFIFGSKSRFEPEANEGEISIYDRDLRSGETHVVSKTPAGQTIKEEGTEIGELGISKDGSRIVIGHLVEENEGAKYWHLYMNVGDSGKTIDLTPGSTHGVLFDGMTEDGSKVFFTTVDPLTTATNQDTDHSADIYQAEVSEAGTMTLTRISTGTEGTGNTDCLRSCRQHQARTLEHDRHRRKLRRRRGRRRWGSGLRRRHDLLPQPRAARWLLQTACRTPPTSTSPGPASRRTSSPRWSQCSTGPQPPQNILHLDHSFGSFGAATGIAVDNSSGDVYIYDTATNRVEKFDSSGKPLSFSAAGSAPYIVGNKLTGTESEPFGGGFAEYGLPTQLAVAPDGDIYVPDFSGGAVDVFAPSGEYLPAKRITLSTPSGVAVDPSDGTVYVGSLYEGVHVYNAASVETLSFSIERNFFAPSIAVNPATGTLYVTGLGIASEGTEIYSSTGVREGALENSKPSFSVTVDPSSGDVYVDEGERIARYDSAGELLEDIGTGQLSGSNGVAFDLGSLYATTAAGTKVAIFKNGLLPGPPIDNPLVLDSVAEPESHHTADFQVTPNGSDRRLPVDPAFDWL